MTTFLARKANFYQQNTKEIDAHKAAFAKLDCAEKTLSCKKNIHIGLFFDGTGNNRDRDEPKSTHTNVVRLYYLHPNSTERGIYSVYIPGVGTRFPDVGEPKDTTFGAAFGNGGAARINYALLAVMNQISIHLTGKEMFKFLTLAKEGRDTRIIAATSRGQLDKNGFAGKFGGYIEEELLPKVSAQILQNRLLKAIPEDKKRTLGQINISVFGFSRGAAEARAFLRHFNSAFPGKKIAGFQCKMYFAGLFDTVASVGLADLLGTKKSVFDGHYSWAKDLTVDSSMVDNCQHFLALHEVRGCFPLDTTEKFVQYAYPGAHSDVGGGYGYSQGKRDISVVAGLHMYYQARLAGVPLYEFSKTVLNKAKKATRELSLSSKIIGDFNQFLTDLSTLVGNSVDYNQLSTTAMNSYFKHRGLIVKTFEKQQFYLDSFETDKNYLRKINSHVNARVFQVGITKYPNNSFEIIKKSSLAGSPDKAGIALTLHNFYSTYVHDSVASFIGMGINESQYDGLGLMKYRGIYKR